MTVNEWLVDPAKVIESLFQQRGAGGEIEDPWKVKKSFQEEFGDNWDRVSWLLSINNNMK